LKIDVLEKDKKILTDELQHLLKVTTQREQQLNKEIKSKEQLYKAFAASQNEIQNQLRSELLQSKTQIKQMLETTHIPPLQINIQMINNEAPNNSELDLLKKLNLNL